MMQQGFTKPIILYAEDDFDDFESLKEALNELSDQPLLMHAKNGAEAISYLENATILPSLLVLDLNMPVMDGKEVLRWLKSRSEYQFIPIIVFTTSSREEDVRLCQKHDCIFLSKPTSYQDLLKVARSMLDLCEKTHSNS